MKKLLLVMITLIFSFASNAYARNWTCHATIHLGSSNYSYTIPGFGMTGNLTTDREKRCKTEIQRRWLNNGAIWKRLGMNAADQNRFCKNNGTFRVDYGFDQRPKSWDFRKTLPSPPCNCAKTCPSGYGIDGGGRCAKGLCQTSLPNKEYLTGNPGTGLYIWSGTIYEAKHPTIGNCTFK